MHVRYGNSLLSWEVLPIVPINAIMSSGLGQIESIWLNLASQLEAALGPKSLQGLSTARHYTYDESYTT
jgi:hypothetical protein